MDLLLQVRVGAAVAGILVAAMAVPLSAQAPASPPKAAVKSSIPRRSDGHPQLQGIWTNASITPLQRPAEFAGKPTIGDEEAAIYEKRTISETSQDRRDGGPEDDRTRGYNALFIDKGTQLFRVNGQKRTSLIVDPPDGKIPPLTPEGQKRAASRRGPLEGGRTIKERPLSERCILGVGGSGGPPISKTLYNNNFQIVQTPDAIMILAEMIHDVRVIHMDGRSHLPSSVRQYLGDSIGHWEGDTLVVETTNFTDKTGYGGSDQNLKVTERFHRIDLETILYRATIDDPTVFTKPWTIEYPFLATQGPIYEYACQEGNYALPDILGGLDRQK